MPRAGYLGRKQDKQGSVANLMTYMRKIDPPAMNWRSFAWSNGAFDTAHRLYDDAVEGTICTPHHLVLVTINGGAEHLEVAAACGHRYVGDDRQGTVSFIPAHCERRFRLRGVRSEWASIALSPGLFDSEALGNSGGSFEVATFTNIDDPFMATLAAEFTRLYKADGGLDPNYCDAMAWALAHHLTRRHGRPAEGGNPRSWKLPPWRMRRIADYVDAHLEEEIRIADLASLVGVSPGHLHRAFHATTGKTPLEFINQRRVQRAMQLLKRESATIVDIALRVGFLSPSHFTRTFRRITGLKPSEYRSGSVNVARNRAGA